MKKGNLINEALFKLTDSADKSDPQGGKVSRDIIKSDANEAASGKVKTALSSSEKARLTNEATIFSETFLRIQKKQAPDDKASTTVVSSAQKSVKGASGPPAMAAKKSGLGLWAIVGAVAVGLFALAQHLQGMFRPLGDFIAKAVFKLKAFAKIFKAFKFGKLFKFLGLTKVIGKIKAFFKANKIVKFFTKIGTTVFKAFGSITKVVSKVFKGGGGFLGKMFKGIIKTVGGKIGKFLKFIPFLGSIVSFGFAYSRWKKGEYIPAIFELISGILNLIPGVGNVVSMVIDGGLLLYDLYTAQDAKEQEDIKAGGTGGFLTKAKEKFMEVIKGKLRYLPFIGGIAHLGDAYNSFMDGQWKDGFISLGKGILGQIGGQGLVDAAMWLVSLLDSDQESTFNFSLPSWDFFADIWGKVGSFFSGIFDGIGGWVTDKIDWIKAKYESITGFVSGAVDVIKSPVKAAGTALGNAMLSVTGAGDVPYADMSNRGVLTDMITKLNAGRIPQDVLDKHGGESALRHQVWTRIQAIDRGEADPGFEEKGKVTKQELKTVEASSGVLVDIKAGVGYTNKLLVRQGKILINSFKELQAIRTGGLGGGSPTVNVQSSPPAAASSSKNYSDPGSFSDSRADYYKSPYSLNATA